MVVGQHVEVLVGGHRTLKAVIVGANHEVTRALVAREALAGFSAEGEALEGVGGSSTPKELKFIDKICEEGGDCRVNVALLGLFGQ